MTEEFTAAPAPENATEPSHRPAASTGAGAGEASLHVSRWSDDDSAATSHPRLAPSRTPNPHSPLSDAGDSHWSQDAVSDSDRDSGHSPLTGSVTARTSPFLRSKRSAGINWRMRLLPNALDRLHEHPQFEVDERGGDSVYRDTTQEILLNHAVVDEDREPLFHLELLRMFRQRLRLLGVLGLILLPLFHLFYMYLSPGIAEQVLFPHLLMLLTCGTYLTFAHRIQNLVWARLLAVTGYALVCTSASLVMATVSQIPVESTANRSIQFVILAAHSQILLSTVLLPLSLWESMVMTIIVTGSLTWSAWWITPDDTGPTRVAQIFVLIMTSVFVLCVAQFQSFLRRRAFDSAFDLARSAAQLRALSTLDTVTGGFNRLHLEKTLSIEINRACRFSHPLSVVMFDLDNFKKVNDTLGHTAGDEVLRSVWQAATTAVRDVDTVARYGGDEFIIVLPETEAADARIIAERLQEAADINLRDYLSSPEGHLRVTLSIGVATISPKKAISVSNLISMVDERLYEAKRMGKNRIAV